MPSPFPGMDPYLEGYLWPDVPHRLATQMSDQLMPMLRPRYVARIDIQMVPDTPEADLGIMYSDVEIVRARPPGNEPPSVSAETGAPTAEALPMTPTSLSVPLLDVEVRLATVEIRDTARNRLVTSMSQSKLEIEIALRDEHLFFRHNGAPFRDREIAHLILHGSTKRDPLDIGRFGTGFITTHLISRRVRVRGQLIDGRSFDFILNREGANARDLQTAMKASQEEFRTSLDRIVPNVPDPYTTEYSYPLSPVVRDVVVEGVDSLKRAVPYVFAFNPMLRRLSILRGYPEI